MADLLKTPIAEARWCKLLGEARPNKFDPSKANSWTCDLVLDNDNKDHAEWLAAMEDKYDELHGSKKKHNHAFPWGPDKEDPKKTVVKFKLNCWTRKDGATSPGPTVFDSARGAWDQKKEIGNGSQVIIGFTIYAWDSPTGGGLSFQPTAMQVLALVERPSSAVSDPMSAFETVPGGYVDSSIPF